MFVILTLKDIVMLTLLGLTVMVVGGLYLAGKIERLWRRVKRVFGR